MPEISKDLLIEEITREVLRVLGKEENNQEAADTSTLPKALVVGPLEKLPKHFKNRYNLFSMDSYEGPKVLSSFERVFVTLLTQNELCDAALGQNNTPASCAITSALLLGKEVFLFHFAPSHRAFKMTAKKGFYQLLEGYVRALQNFGVTLISENSPTERFISPSPEVSVIGGVVTEGTARELCKKISGDKILLKKGSVVTPSARDVFLHEGKQIEFV